MNDLFNSLPDPLKSAVEACLLQTNIKILQSAALKLSKHYRRRESIVRLTKLDKLAYLAVRLPAIYAAALRTLANLPKNTTAPKSLLDLGSGPGTLIWAALKIWPSLKTATLLEKDGDWIELAKKLSLRLPGTIRNNIQWHQKDLTSIKELQTYDVLTMSYVLGELPWSEELLEKIWQATRKYLILIEPGTPQGFEVLSKVRSYLIKTGASLASPCTHANECPLLSNDWCHFTTRLNRFPFHRLVKMASLGYEDEKFCYLIFSRKSVQKPQARIIKRPKKGSGHILLDLCGSEGLERITVSKKQKDLYSIARKKTWGSSWSPRKLNDQKAVSAQDIPPKT